MVAEVYDRDGGEGMTDKMADGAMKFITIVLMAAFLMLGLMSMVGCSTPVAPDCPVAPKCPDTYAGLYMEEQRAADRLEDALSKAEGESRACVRVFEDSQKKSSR